MKTFSDLLDIDTPRVDVDIVVIPIIDNGSPMVDLTVNGNVIFSGELLEQKTFKYTCEILDKISVIVNFHGKHYSQEKETAVIIERLQVDKIDIVPDFNHLIEYRNDHNQEVYSNYLGYNGVWKFETHKPFYQWLHHATGKGWLID